MKEKIKLDLLWFTLTPENNFDFAILNSERLFYSKLFKALIRFPSFRVVFMIRLAQFLSNFSKVCSYPFFKYLSFFHHISVSYYSEIEGGLRLPHPTNIIISASRVGKMVTIGQNVTIGGNFGKRDQDGYKTPVIGAFSFLSAGCVIGGPIIIGNDVIVGANSVVVRDIVAHSIVSGNPLIKFKPKTRSRDVKNIYLDSFYMGLDESQVFTILTYE
ncbi:hypothetical protein [Lunatimonas salinarum]|uniref:hypothetical protein n=1 Tax=Lunatimonas salinarum TaxID=1774590 RepID=UPI001ADEF3AA|nr:hypothetical protein [Lunatimonas salinarum]